MKTTSGRPTRRLALSAVAAALCMVVAQGSTALANVRVQKVSNDPFTNTSSYHKTQVEPDTYAWGSTIVSAFQTGRFSDGGSSDVGWATSTDSGATWAHGYLPGVTIFSDPPGPFQRDTDPSVAYDAKHAVWLIQTLGMNGTGGAAVIVNRSKDGGLTWTNPVTILNQNGADKNWIACDNTASSLHFGNCYAEWDDNGTGNTLFMSTSVDGGKTWTLAQVPDTSVIGGQPLAAPDGTVVVPTDNGFEGSAESFVSADGGKTYTGPFAISSIQNAGNAGNLRTPPLPSAEVDAGGKVYVVWSDCRFRAGCSSNDIVMSTSGNGKTWSSVVRIPIDGVNSGADHFIPGIGVDPTTKGNTAHLAVTYYFYPDASCSPSTCDLEVGFISSKDGGAHWSTALQLAGPMSVLGLPLTTQGYMVGDYISTSFLGSKAFTVFAKSKGTSCVLGQITSCRQKMVAPLAGLTITGGSVPVGRERPVALGLGRATGGPATAS